VGGEAGVIIPPEALPFAELQMGEIDKWKGDPLWHSKANELVQQRYHTIRNFLPAKCHNMMDIGGGVAATDVPIMKHYDVPPNLYVLDGSWWDISEPVTHRVPFNDHRATQATLKANGLSLAGFITPAEAENWNEAEANPIGPFDLIVSFAAWGFHFSPATYMNFILKFTKPGTRVIFDLRLEKMEWKEILQQQFKLISLTHSSRKFVRAIYEKI
jgi:hypothetical protein